MESMTTSTSASPAAQPSRRSLRGARTALIALVFGLFTAGAVAFGGGVAHAAGGSVVGMSETDAQQTLESSGTPYQTMARFGGGTDCVVTGEEDLGYATHGYTDSDGDRQEDVVWKGLGLTLNCT